MADPLGRGRPSFRLPRVEFDLAGLLLGTLLVVAYAFFWQAMALVLSVASVQAGTAEKPAEIAAPHVLRNAVVETVAGPLGSLPGVSHVLDVVGYTGPAVRASAANPRMPEAVPLGVAGWKVAVSVAALVLLWSILGGALARVYAVRKARETSVRFDDALAFSAGALGQFLRAPLFALGAGALAVAAVLACGALTAVPWAGPVLQLVAQPLSFLAALFVVVVAVGLVLGYPTMTAAIAVERGGSLDAVSRTFSYVWTRPVTWAVSSLVVLAVTAVIRGVASFLFQVWQSLFTVGASWIDGGFAEALRGAARAALTFASPAVPADATGSQAASLWIGWAIAAVTMVLLRGFAVSYLVGGFVDVYFLLREEVDQVDATEVFVEGATASLGEPVPGEPRAG
jgi:hypothetical protein